MTQDNTRSNNLPPRRNGLVRNPYPSRAELEKAPVPSDDLLAQTLAEPPRVFATVDTVSLTTPGEEDVYLRAWRNVPEWERPAGPEEDYYGSDHEPAEWELRHRWKGLGMETRISDLFAVSQRVRLQTRLNNLAKRNEGLGQELTPELLNTLDARAFLTLYSWYLSEMDDGVRGLTRVPEKRLYPGHGVRTEVIVRPRTDKEKATHMAMLRNMFTMLQTYRGEASVIIGHQGNSLTEEKRDEAARELDEWRQKRLQERQQNLSVTVNVHPNGNPLPEREPIEVPALMRPKSS